MDCKSNGMIYISIKLCPWVLMMGKEWFLDFLLWLLQWQKNMWNLVFFQICASIWSGMVMDIGFPVNTPKAITDESALAKVVKFVFLGDQTKVLWQLAARTGIRTIEEHFKFYGNEKHSFKKNVHRKVNLYLLSRYFFFLYFCRKKNKQWNQWWHFDSRFNFEVCNIDVKKNTEINEGILTRSSILKFAILM